MFAWMFISVLSVIFINKYQHLALYCVFDYRRNEHCNKLLYGTYPISLILVQTWLSNWMHHEFVLLSSSKANDALKLPGCTVSLLYPLLTLMLSCTSVIHNSKLFSRGTPFNSLIPSADLVSTEPYSEHVVAICTTGMLSCLSLK